MATLISKATGNFTAAGTWNLALTEGLVNSRAGQTTLTTSYVYSPNFTPSAVEVDAIGIKFRSNTGVGTIDIILENVTDAVTVETITINASDIATATDANASYEMLGYYVFKLSAPVTLNAAKNYRIGLRMASSAVVTVWRTSTAGDWSKFLRRTATQAPAAGDDLIIVGEKANGGAYSSFVVTMDSTANTAYYDFYICKYGKLTYGVAASTNYYLRTRNIWQAQGSEFYIGESGSAMPSTSTAVLEFNCASNNQYSLKGYSCTFEAHGHDRGITAFQKLQANVSAAGTSIQITDTTGWAANDQVAFASSSTTTTANELRTINTITNSTTFTITAGMTAAKNVQESGACKPGVMNLTRNIQIRGISTTNVSTLSFYGLSRTIFNWVSFRYMGSSTSAQAFISDSATYPNFPTITLNNCSFYDQATAGQFVSIVQGVIDLNITNLLMYGSGNHIYLTPRYTSTHSVSGIYSIGCTGIEGVLIGCANTFEVSNVYTAGGQSSSSNRPVLKFGPISANQDYVSPPDLTVTNIEVHSCSQAAMTFSAHKYAYYENIITWNLVTTPSVLVLGNTNILQVNTYDSFNHIKNVTNYITNGGTGGLIRIGEVSFATTASRFLIEDFVDNAAEANSTIIAFAGTATAYGDVCIKNLTTNLRNLFGASGQPFIGTVSLVGLTWNAVTKSEFVNTRNTFMDGQSLCKLTSYDHLGVAGKIKSWAYAGDIETDTTFAKTGSKSIRATYKRYQAATVMNKLIAARKLVRVASGNTVTVSVWVRKSVVGDGTAYTGAQPRLILRANQYLGINTDTVLDTATAASDGAWEELTGTTAAVDNNGVLEFYVDCDGLTSGSEGWINVDDFTSNTNEDGTSCDFIDAYGNADFGDAGSGGGGVAGGSFTFS